MQQEVLLQQMEHGEIDQEEFEQLQAALIASMQEQEEIVVGEDEDEGVS